MRRLLARIAPLLLAIGIALGSAPATRACGPSSVECWFTFDKHPDLPLERFAAGQLGIIQPTWARSYKVIAFRHLAGLGLDAEEQAQAVALWRDRLDLEESKRPEGRTRDVVEDWLAARIAAGATSKVTEIPRYVHDGDSWSWVLNCRDDAFVAATTTLAERTARQGAGSAELLEWLSAQDMVFDACDGTGDAPGRIERATATAADHAERAYQQAALTMYRGAHDEARAMFLALAADPAFPRPASARYLAARCLVRKSLWKTTSQPEDLAAASAALRALIADPAASAIHADAERLLSLVRMRGEPNALLADAAAACASPRVPDLRSHLDRLTRLLDAGATAPGSEMLDWIGTWEMSVPQARAHAAERWTSTRSLPWLVTLLELGAPDPATRDAALDAAAQVPDSNPARPALVFGAARMLIRAGRHAEATSWIDASLATEIPPGTRNALLAMRMELSSDEASWWAAAIRRAPGCGSDESGLQVGDAPSAEGCGDALVDNDASTLISRGLPTSRLIAAARMASIPASLRRRLALAAWTRAIVLDDDASALQAAAVVRELEPSMVKELDAWSAEDAATRRFAGAHVILWHPGLRPEVEPGCPRQAPLAASETMRNAWWCDGPRGTWAWSGFAGESVSMRGKTPGFLTEQERRVALDEGERLWSAGSGAVALGDIVIAWARDHATDPRVPEALHRVVRATRFGCGSHRNSEISKAAFTLLHERWSGSEWARRTKYWY